MLSQIGSQFFLGRYKDLVGKVLGLYLDSKGCQRGHRVIADGKDGNRFVGLCCSLQLDQLRSTPRSPIGTAMEDHKRQTAGPVIVITRS